MGDCIACDEPLSQYDIFRVSCDNGHVWTLPEFADMPIPPEDGRPRPVRVLKVPAWLPGAVLGGLALVVSLLEVVL